MHKRNAQSFLRLAAAITPVLAAAVLAVPSSAGEARISAVITYRSPAALRRKRR
jgi:hypothetical protein